MKPWPNVGLRRLICWTSQLGVATMPILALYQLLFSYLHAITLIVLLPLSFSCAIAIFPLFYRILCRVDGAGVKHIIATINVPKHGRNGLCRAIPSSSLRVLVRRSAASYLPTAVVTNCCSLHGLVTHPLGTSSLITD